MAKNTKKKALLIGLGLFWLTAITTISIVAPLTLRKNTEKSGMTQTQEFVEIKTSLLNSNEKQVKIRIDNLDDYLGQWLLVEYQPKPASELNLTSSVNVTSTRSFFVRSKTEYVEIGGLIPSIKYDYKIKEKDGKYLTQSQIFSTFSRPELMFDAEETSISFISSELNREYLNSAIVVRYKKYEDSLVSPNSYVNSGEIAVAVELKEIDGKSFYAISGEIFGLEKSTPYVLTLHIRGQEGPITNPEVVWTKGNEAKLIVLDPTSTTAKSQISGLDDYITDPNEAVVFWLNYTKKGVADPESKKVRLKLDTEKIVSSELVELEPNTEYEVSLFKLEDEIELELTSKIDFWTLPQPFVQEKEFDGITTKWRKSDVNAKMVVSGLKSKSSDATKSLIGSDLTAVAVEIAESTATPDFSSATKVSSELAIDGTTDDYNVSFTNLTAGKFYAVQVFKKTDTEFKKPLLTTAFVETQMPTLFTAENSDITSAHAVVTLKEMNNYKTDELVVQYWKKSTPATKMKKVVTFEGEVTEVAVMLDNLDALTEYEYEVLPVYSGLQTEVDNLLEAKGTITTLGILTGRAVEGNNFTTNVTFKLAGMDSKFPLNKPVKLQWRIKPTDLTTAWATADTNNSHDFTVTTTPTDGNHTIEIPNHQRVNTWFTGVTYEWRVIDPATPTENLVKAGTLEFKLEDDQITSTFTDKITPLYKEAVNWRAPLMENVVGSALGNAGSTGIWRQFFGIEKKANAQYFLEWLAFQDETIQDKWAATLKWTFEAYTAKDGTKASSKNNNLTGRWIAVPFFPNNEGGDVDNGSGSDFLEAATQDFPKLGGYTNTENSSDSPIKPSDFMSSNSKFIDSSALPKALKYYLNGIKDGWNGRSTNIGITRSNIFTDGNTESKDKTYASYLATKKTMDGNIKLSGVADKDANGWTLEVEDTTSANKAFIVNDLTGDLYVKVKATKDGKTHYYWHKISDFQKATEVAPTATDLTFELYGDHTKTARLIKDELDLVTDVEAKKKVIQKYFRAKIANVFTDSWKFVSAELTADGTSLTLKATIPTKKIEKGTFDNLNDSASLSSTEEFTYTLKGYDFTKMPNLDLLMTGQKGTIETAQSGLSVKSRYYNITWTYEQMLSKMKHAVSESETAVETLATEIINGLSLETDWIAAVKPNTENPILVLRATGAKPIASWGDFTLTDKERKVDDANKDTFYTRTDLTDFTTTNRKAKVVEMIKHYGAKPTSTPKTT